MISYCTPCKNRLHHLKQTLPRTLSNLDIGDEVVLLNYDSTDGLHEWIIENKFPSVRYVCLNEGEQPFKMGRAKNIAHIEATNPIVCNLDADNWIVPGFSKFIIDNLKSKNMLLRAQQYYCGGGGCGRVAMFKQSFLALGGYDERMQSWGYDVTDLCLRATKMLHWSIGQFLIEDVKFLTHLDSARSFILGLDNCTKSAYHNKKYSDQTLASRDHNPNLDTWGKGKLKRYDVLYNECE